MLVPVPSYGVVLICFQSSVMSLLYSVDCQQLDAFHQAMMKQLETHIVYIVVHCH